MHSDSFSANNSWAKVIKRILVIVGSCIVLLAFGLWLFVRHVYSELDASLGALERQHTQSVALSEKPVVLTATATRFAAGEPLEVKGMTGEFCLLLSRNVDVKGNIDVQYRHLLGEARLKAVLHARNGKDYTWTRGGWQAPFGPVEGRGALLTCLWLLCSEEHPPKGTEFTSIDVSSDRPLRILGASWYSSDSFDGAYAPEHGSPIGSRCAVAGNAVSGTLPDSHSTTTNDN